MSSILLSKSEQGIVVFHIWKSLPYKTRILLSSIFILSGFIIQYIMFHYFPGVLLVLAGNLLVVVKGYDNRIKLKSLKHDAEWVSTDEEHLLNIISLLKRMKKWDISALDITNGLGFFLLALVIIAMFVFFAVNPFSSNNGAIIVVANLALLLIPHWVTGTKKIMTNPSLETKIKIYLELLTNFKESLKEDTIKFTMLVQGKDHKFPLDVKMQVKFKDQPDDFLGLYTQIAMNNVQGADYPYFYVVLVAKTNFKLLDTYFNLVETPQRVLKESNSENDTDIIIIRQVTSKSEGYHTNYKAVLRIFETGIQSARKIIKSN